MSILFKFIFCDISFFEKFISLGINIINGKSSFGNLFPILFISLIEFSFEDKSIIIFFKENFKNNFHLN